MSTNEEQECTGIPAVVLGIPAHLTTLEPMLWVDQRNNVPAIFGCMHEAHMHMRHTQLRLVEGYINGVFDKDILQVVLSMTIAECPGGKYVKEDSHPLDVSDLFTEAIRTAYTTGHVSMQQLIVAAKDAFFLHPKKGGDNAVVH